MEIRVLEKGLAGTFRTNSVLVGQVILETVGQFRLVHCDFPSAEEEREFFESQEHLGADRVEMMRHMGGSGCVTILESDSDSRIEIFGPVRALAPALRQAADAFEARLRELPTE